MLFKSVSIKFMEYMEIYNDERQQQMKWYNQNTI